MISAIDALLVLGVGWLIYMCFNPGSLRLGFKAGNKSADMDYKPTSKRGRRR